jgi:hypothetical protein
MRVPRRSIVLAGMWYVSVRFRSHAMTATIRVSLVCMMIVSCAPRRPKPTDILATSGRHTDLSAAAAQAGAPPAGALGSREKPIKARGPRGEREFLVRLRCPDSTAPAFERLGSTEPGADDHILDSYIVQCPGKQLSLLLLMDMYHDYRETEPVPPFTVLANLPARAAQGCPPRVADPDSSLRYVFTEFEVDSPAVTLQRVPQWIDAPISGYAYVEFVVDTLGRVELPSLMIQAEPKEVAALARALLDTIRFRPAIHHTGCLVRQRVAGPLEFDRR